MSVDDYNTRQVGEPNWVVGLDAMTEGEGAVEPECDHGWPIRIETLEHVVLASCISIPRVKWVVKWAYNQRKLLEARRLIGRREWT